MDKYQIFEPGKYLDWEKPIVEERLALAQGTPSKERTGPTPPVSEFELLRYNKMWDPYNSLFNNKEYARKAGYPDVPALPLFRHPSEAIYRIAIPLLSGIGYTWSEPDVFYFAHGPNDVEMFAPIYPSDTFTTETEKLMFEDITTPGSTLRHFRNGCIMKLYNQRDELVVRHTLWRREAYRKIIDGSPAPSYHELIAQQRPHSPAHYTTDEEWNYIQELWGKEVIRGQDTLYWEDVNVGDEPPLICSGPVTYMDMALWHSDMLLQMPPIRVMLQGGNTNLFRDRFGQYLSGVSQMYGGRNMPGERALMYNSTAAMLVRRMLTNYVGDAGFVTRIGWVFHQTFEEMRYPREGGEYLDQVPYMKGKACTVHPSEGDTVIGKGYVTNKYVNDRGEHIIDLVCWAETLDKRIVQAMPAAARLPSREG